MNSGCRGDCLGADCRVRGRAGTPTIQLDGPERNFDLEIAFDDAGVIRSMKMRALDSVGAYAGARRSSSASRWGAIVGPYRIKSVQYRAIAVLSNKTVQEAVRDTGLS